MDISVNGEKTGWQLGTVSGEFDGEVEKPLINRVDGRYYHISMVEGDDYSYPMIFEHDLGEDKVGDIVVVLRQNPSGRYTVQVDQERAFLNETDFKLIWRAKRSSLDNVEQAVKRTVAHTGWLYANARRIGGKPIKVHYIVAGWSPQATDEMMDVFDYVQSLDSMGLAAFLKALQCMPAEPAQRIFDQIRTPSS